MKFPLRITTEVVKTGREIASKPAVARANYLMARGGGKAAMKGALDKAAKAKGFDFGSSVILDYVNPERVSDAARDFGAARGSRVKRKA